MEMKPKKKLINRGKTKKKNHNSYHNGEIDEIESGLGNDDNFGTTQIMAGSTQEGQRTERPLIAPSLSPPWVLMNTANNRQSFLSQFLFLILLHMMTL